MSDAPQFIFRRDDAEKDPPPRPLVLVEWVDAYAYRGGWRDADEAMEDIGDTYLVYTAGWLMQETLDALRVCCQVHPFPDAGDEPPEASQVDFVQTIPRPAVRKVTHLRREDARDAQAEHPPTDQRPIFIEPGVRACRS